MKIRIKDNSVRFRLTQIEVKTLSEKGHVEAHTDFGDGKFTYQVSLKENLITLKASFSNGVVGMEVPKKWGEDWYENDVVGIDHAQPLKNDEELYLLLEKDFTCLDNTLEDQSDNYPNPKLQSS
ncbi:hypothetical protein [Allomuricauda sp. d1]|uniref:DUF7009 family protein n=1 Tax=Allomuricauda sp. d1 TaxID=3136725 RepID=UPI0031D29B66